MRVFWDHLGVAARLRSNALPHVRDESHGMSYSLVTQRLPVSSVLHTATYSRIMQVVNQ